MCSVRRYSRSASGTNRSSIANHRVTLCSRSRRKDHAGIEAIFPGSTLGLSGSDGHALGLTHRARPVMPATVALGSRRLAGFRRRLSRGAWLFPSLCCGLSRFGRGFNQRWRFQPGLFRSAMMAMVQRLDARGFFFHPQLSVAIFLALVFQSMPESFSLSWLECGRTCDFQAVHFSSMSPVRVDW